MRGLGAIALIVGIIWMAVAASADVSVATGLGGRVNNLGLMADRSNHTMIGGIIAIAGLLMVIFGGKKSEPASVIPVIQDDARPCPFCAEWIKHAAIRCKHCGAEVESVAREVEPQLRFGWVARVICSDQAARERITQAINSAGLPVVEMLKVGGIGAGAFAKKSDAQQAAQILEQIGMETTVMYRDSTSGDYA